MVQVETCPLLDPEAVAVVQGHDPKEGRRDREEYKQPEVTDQHGPQRPRTHSTGDTREGRLHREADAKGPRDDGAKRDQASEPRDPQQDAVVLAAVEHAV